MADLGLTDEEMGIAGDGLTDEEMGLGSVPTSAQPVEPPVENGGQTAEQARWMDTVEKPTFKLDISLAPLGIAPPKPAPPADPASRRPLA